MDVVVVRAGAVVEIVVVAKADVTIDLMCFYYKNGKK